MKRWLWVLPILTIAVGVVVEEKSRGQVPAGPGDGGATLRLPGLDPTPALPSNSKAAPLPYYLQNLEKKSAASAYPPLSNSAKKVALPPSNAVEINKDIEVTPEAGQWMIFVMAYTGPKAPEMARKFVGELRGHYKLNAYVFNYGAEEKRKEYERVQKIRQEQIDALEKAGLKADVPIRVPAIRIDEQTGVLVGGYKSFDEAAIALKQIKKLDPEGLKGKVELDSKTVTEYEKGKPIESAKIVNQEQVLVNPFLKAFPARNPATPKEQPASTSEEDLREMRKVNSGEPFSLLQCKKPYTLVIKQYNMQHKTVGNVKEATGFMERFTSGFSLRNKEWEDIAAHNAHNLAEALRKSGLQETYVLHVKHSSYVTVGAFSALGDPQMTSMQNYLETRFKMDAYRAFEFFPRPIPMPVPGVAMK